MTYRSYSPGLFPAPPSVRWLIIVTSLLSLGSAIFERFMTQILGLTNPQHLFGLSWGGLKSLYIWQVVTCFLVQPLSLGVTFPFMLKLALCLYLIWTIAPLVANEYGERTFLFLSLGSGVCAAVIPLFFLLPQHSSPLLLGSGPVVFGLLSFWALLHPNQELVLLNQWRVEVRWVSAAVLGGGILLSLSYGYWIYVTSLFSAISYAFGYSFLVCQKVPPLLSFFSQKFNSYAFPPKETSKIFDIRTGRAVLRDEQFMDAMLEKVSREGEDSLTNREKRRMNEISRRKPHFQSKTN